MMPRDHVPVVEVTSCYRCPMRAASPRRHCQLTGADLNYNAVPRGCPLRGGPVQIALATHARKED